MEKLEHIQKNKMFKRLENCSTWMGYKKRPKDPRIFNLEKKSLKGDLLEFKHMKSS
jgi:hypothetical protein